MLSFGKTMLAGLAVAALAHTSSFGVSARRVRRTSTIPAKVDGGVVRPLTPPGMSTITVKIDGGGVRTSTSTSTSGSKGSNGVVQFDEIMVQFDEIEKALSARDRARITGRDGGEAGSGEGGYYAPLLCCMGACFSTPFIFLILWQIATLWGPSAGEGLYELFFKCDTHAYKQEGMPYMCEDGNPWQIYQDASGKPTGLQALPWTCKEYTNKPIFGALTPQDGNEHGARMQEIMKISLLYYAAGTTIWKVLYSCCGLENREEKKPNCFGKLLVNAHALTIVGLWLVQCISLDFNRRNDEVCEMMTRWVDPVTIMKANATMPHVLVEDTHMHDLGMTSTVLGGVTVALIIMHFLVGILSGRWE